MILILYLRIAKIENVIKNYNLNYNLKLTEIFFKNNSDVLVKWKDYFIRIPTHLPLEMEK
jgi:hypothetical protein